MSEFLDSKFSIFFLSEYKLTLKISIPSENGPGLHKPSSSEPLSHRNSVDMPAIKAFQDTQASHLKRHFIRKGMHLESMKNNPSLHLHTNSDHVLRFTVV